MGEEEFKTEYDRQWEAYFYPNTDVLINKFDITDFEELKEREAEVSFERLVELYEEPIVGEFDAEHLKNIHRYLFQDVYDWAGEYRLVNMQKQTGFTDYRQIDDYLNSELSLMEEEFKNVDSEYALAAFLATYYAQLLIIHPFREGNGRSTREFMREFVLEKTKSKPYGSFELDWTKFNGETLLDDIQFALVFRGVMEREFQKALVRIEPNNQFKI